MMEFVSNVGSLPFGTGQVCRTCLADAADAISWHETVSQHGYTATILDMLVFLGFIVGNEEKEEYPDTVCQDCITKLMIAYQFKLTCADASAMLASLPPPQELPINFDNLTDLEIIQLDHGYDLPFPNFNPEAIDDLNLDSEDDHDIEQTTRKENETVKKKIRKIKDKQLLYPCTLCPKTYTRPSNLRDHLASHSDSRDYLCIQCGKAFNSLSLLRQHMRSHSTERPHACNMCNKRYNRKQRLKEHIHVAHSNDKYSHKCQECGKGFTSKTYLKLHLKMHEGVKDFKCDLCGKMFTRATYLRFHRQSHPGKGQRKSFPCPQDGCDRTFSRKHSVGVHLAYAHSTERYFECEICQKKFVTSSGLRNHKETHSTAFIICNFCGRALSSKDTLRRHMKLHKANQAIENGSFVSNIETME